MKYLLIAAAIFISLPAFAQGHGGMEFGGVFSTYKDAGSAYGGKLAAHASTMNGAGTFGGGFQIMKFKNMNGIYTPIFLSIGSFFKPNKDGNAFYFHLDPGYGIYNSETKDQFTSTTTKTTGGIFLTTGFGIKLKGSVSPYIAFNYSAYGFSNKVQTGNRGSSSTNTISSFTLNIGIWIPNKK